MPPEVAVSLARRVVRLSIATVPALALATAAATAQTTENAAWLGASRTVSMTVTVSF